MSNYLNLLHPSNDSPTIPSIQQLNHSSREEGSDATRTFRPLHPNLDGQPMQHVVSQVHAQYEASPLHHLQPPSQSARSSHRYHPYPPQLAETPSQATPPDWDHFDLLSPTTLSLLVQDPFNGQEQFSSGETPQPFHFDPAITTNPADISGSTQPSLPPFEMPYSQTDIVP